MVKLLDFGVSKIMSGNADPQLTDTHSMMGSPAYISPEQMRSTRDVDERTDIWSLGAVLFEMVTGRVAWSGSTLAGAEPHAPRGGQRTLLYPSLPAKAEPVLTIDAKGASAKCANFGQARAATSGIRCAFAHGRQCRGVLVEGHQPRATNLESQWHNVANGGTSDGISTAGTRPDERSKVDNRWLNGSPPAAKSPNGSPGTIASNNPRTRVS